MGSAIGTTRAFTVATEPWTVHWSFDCFGRRGTFALGVDRMDSSLATADRGVSDTAVTDGGTVTYTDTGTYTLTITTQCDWTVQVS